jgi:hypothetical protein
MKTTTIMTFVLTIVLFSCGPSKEKIKAKSYAFGQNVELTGALSRVDFTDENAKGRSFYVLKLTSPIDVTATNTNKKAQSNVQEIQVVFEDENVSQPDARLFTSKITVKGDFYNKETDNYYRSVVMTSAVVIPNRD